MCVVLIFVFAEKFPKTRSKKIYCITILEERKKEKWRERYEKERERAEK